VWEKLGKQFSFSVYFAEASMRTFVLEKKKRGKKLVCLLFFCKLFLSFLLSVFLIKNKSEGRKEKAEQTCFFFTCRKREAFSLRNFFFFKEKTSFSLQNLGGLKPKKKKLFFGSGT